MMSDKDAEAGHRSETGPRASARSLYPFAEMPEQHSDTIFTEGSLRDTDTICIFLAG